MITDARWIWIAGDDGTDYNLTGFARREVELESIERGVIEITADSWYRLFINHRWIADGPARGWPDHYQYDQLDVSNDLVEGRNVIEVLVRYFGCGTFHQVPQRAGLLASLDVTGSDGSRHTVATDSSWQFVHEPAVVQNTPKVSIQMEPFEWVDATVGEAPGVAPGVATDVRAGTGTAAAAEEICGPKTGWWTGLARRSTPMLTDVPKHGIRITSRVVETPGTTVAVPAARILYPGAIEANHSVSMAHAICCRVRCDATEPRIATWGYRVWLDGRPVPNADASIQSFEGEAVLFAAPDSVFGHRKDLTLALSPGLEPAQPWMLLVCPDLLYQENDLQSFWFPKERMIEIDEEFSGRATEAAAHLESGGDPGSIPGFEISEFPNGAEPVCDPHAAFMQRRVVVTDDRINGLAAMLHDNPDVVRIEPVASGDVEIMIDFGEQVCGYYELDLRTEAGTVIDLFSVEYVRDDGAVQHTTVNRNGCRYRCRDGRNRFTSTKRRSGRYLFATIREQRGPVLIRLLRVREATYPRELIGSFSSSDPRLDRIWRISERTLELCMEDTFTDCPLYEQTLWVGDARNEALFALPTYGATDIVRRCIEVAGQSLDRYPIVGSQVPSSWDTLLPAWSFLWGISVWDYFFYSGDREFLEMIWPRVVRNLDGASAMLDERGLFSGKHWNMFDWTAIDHEHETVLHNSMFLVGALEAAIACGEALGRDGEVADLDSRRRRLIDAINATWNDETGAYPDSIHENGEPSGSVSLHTSFLPVLYHISTGARRESAIETMCDPPAGVVGVGSPFAILYLYEALDSVGSGSLAVDSIYQRYLPMLEAGATTVWEMFPESEDHPEGYPTRSHVHAWSSAPLYVLPRVILGIRQREPGGASFTVSPSPCGLEHARGTVATARGPLEVSFRLQGRVLDIDARGPEGVAISYEPNPAVSGYEVRWNGERIKE